MIKAIETHYKGCAFRSRLEARWAVFFSELGIEWLYEPQGFEVAGQWYLPDFLLPDLGCYFEVKGPYEGIKDGLYKRFAEQANMPLVAAVSEIPFHEGEYSAGQGDGYLYTFLPESLIDNHDSDWGRCWGHDDVFIRCDICNRVSVGNACYLTGKNGCCDGRGRDSSPSVQLKLARKARFEHGNCGTH